MRIALIYLAAGNSHRFGSNKLLYPIEGKPMYRHVLDRLTMICRTDSRYSLTVVTQYDEIAGRLAENPAIRVAFSPESKNGAAYSVRAGIEAAGEADAYVFFVADQPYLSEKTVREFLDFAAAQPPGGIVCVSAGGETGNPVWFDAAYRTELLALSGDRGGKAVVRRHLDSVRLFEITDAAELTDIDSLN